MNLENEKTKIAYELWAENLPESLHFYDIERFNNLALLLLENEDEIGASEIESTLGNNFEEHIVDYYIERFSALRDLYELMIKNGYSK